MQAAEQQRLERVGRRPGRRGTSAHGERRGDTHGGERPAPGDTRPSPHQQITGQSSGPGESNCTPSDALRRVQPTISLSLVTSTISPS